MRKNDLTIVLGFCLFLLGSSASAEPSRYELDPDHVTVAFLVERVGFCARPRSIYHCPATRDQPG